MRVQVHALSSVSCHRSREPLFSPLRSRRQFCRESRLVTEEGAALKSRFFYSNRRWGSKSLRENKASPRVTDCFKGNQPAIVHGIKPARLGRPAFIHAEFDRSHYHRLNLFCLGPRSAKLLRRGNDEADNVVRIPVRPIAWIIESVGAERYNSAKRTECNLRIRRYETAHVPCRHQPRGDHGESTQRFAVRSRADLGLYAARHLGRPRLQSGFLPGFQLPAWRSGLRWARIRTRRTQLPPRHHNLFLEQRKAQLLPSGHQPRSAAHEPAQRIALRTRADVGMG
jgi:hypothetical protein